MRPTEGTRGLPWRPRALAPGEIRARRRILDRFPVCGLTLPLERLGALVGAADLRLSIRHVTPAAELSPGDRDTLVALSSGVSPGSPRGVIGLPSDLACAIVVRALRRVGPLARPLSSGEEGVLMYALDRFGADWAAVGGAPFFVRGLLADPDQIGAYLDALPRWCVGLGVEGQGISAEARLWIAEAGPIRKPPGALGLVRVAGDWPVEMRISVGRARLDVDAVRALQTGDTIILDAGSFSHFGRTAGAIVVSSGRWMRFGRWQDDRRIALVLKTERGVDMDQKADQTEELAVSLESGIDSDAASMEVVVQVEIGAVRMSVDQAARLVPGRILTLDREVGPEVVLKVGDKRIGRGEIVEYEGRLAVEVTEAG